MKILVLCLSPGRGGLELYAYRELQQMRARGHTCMAVVTPDGMLAARAKEAGIPSIGLRTRVRALPLLAARRLAAIMDGQQVDILHIHWARDLALAVLAKRFASRKVRLVYSRHMGITRSKGDPYHRLLYRQVDRMLVISRQVLQQARDYLPMPHERVELLYHGVAAGLPRDEQKCHELFQGEAAGSRRFRIGLFGRIEHGKGQHLLLEALQALVSQGREVGAIIVGNAMDEAYYQGLRRSVRERGLEGYVSFRPYMDNLPEVMPCLEVIVLTTYCETFGLVLIEAMRAGVAVVGTRAGGVPEIITHEQSGMMFEPGDAAGLAQCLLRLNDDEPFRKQMAAAGKARADELFSAERHYLQLENTLTGLLA